MPRDLFSSVKYISLEYLAQQTHKQILKMQQGVFISQLQGKKLMTVYRSNFQLQAGWVFLGLEVAPLS